MLVGEEEVYFKALPTIFNYFKGQDLLDEIFLKKWGKIDPETIQLMSRHCLYNKETD